MFWIQLTERTILILTTTFSLFFSNLFFSIDEIIALDRPLTYFFIESSEKSATKGQRWQQTVINLVTLS